ncbi:MAG: flavin reductase family protein [Lachnospiraceae bacterium]|nr:flavin reductase family protein [Lachnospiraceae bacterium]
MRKNFGAKPWVYPMPVFIIATYDENGKANAMNAAWDGVSGDTEICICMGKNHKTTENLKKNPEFTVSMADMEHIVACDYVGLVSGKDTPDKMEKAGFTTSKAEFVNAPVINELPMTIECRMTSYDEESGHLFADIINVSADERILTDGGIDISKLRPIAYDPVSHAYVECSQKVGNAFKDGLDLK